MSNRQRKFAPRTPAQPSNDCRRPIHQRHRVRFLQSIQLSLLLAVSALGFAGSGMATELNVTGRVLQAQGHQSAACRMLQIRENGTGRIVWLRIPNTGADNSILSVALTALTSGLSVLVDYNSAVTTGCGPEPAVTWISILSPG